MYTVAVNLVLENGSKCLPTTESLPSLEPGSPPPRANLNCESGNGKRKRKAEKGQGRHCNTYNVIVRHARPG